MLSFDEKLEKYAELIVKIGVNVQKDQTVVIRSSIEAAPLSRLIAKYAFEVGAYDVIVDWRDEKISLERYKHAPLSVFKTSPEHWVAELTQLAKKGACFISITSDDPDLLKNVATQEVKEKAATDQKTMAEALSEFRELLMANTVSWTVVAAASPAWAQKVFPDLSADEQLARLWEAIFETTRINTEDPVSTWKEHEEILNKKAKLLNENQFDSLHYKAPGTDLSIGLPKNHVWVGAGSINKKGHPFIANMPTEEVFCCAEKTRVNGYVSSTKPLSYAGTVIQDFKLTFKEGRIIEVEAKQGEETLKNLIETDEGAHYLGEIALVPDPSPISQSGILFYNTLFDENASNHLAIGQAYAFNIKGGEELTREELDKCGVNRSVAHVDFMIGSSKMDIDGITKSGKKVPVFRNGDWAL